MMPNPRCPFAIPAFIEPESSRQPFITPRVAIMHRHGSKGSSRNVGRYFGREDVRTESHFSIARDARIFQFVPVNRRADAQHAGNAYAVSIETEDNGVWEAVWTPPQIGAIVRVLRWLREEWSIPGRLVSRPGEPGIGYHKQFTEWNRNAHYCPSDAMVRQLRAQIIPELTNRPTTSAGVGETEDDDVKELVEHLQRGLKAAGLYKGVVDGVWGDKTQAAWDAVCGQATPGAFDPEAGAQALLAIKSLVGVDVGRSWDSADYLRIVEGVRQAVTP